MVESTSTCADGRCVAVGCVEPPFYAQMLAILGIDDQDLRFQIDPTGWAQLKQVIGAKFKERPRDEWAELFAPHDACVSPVLSPWEAHEHPHNHARDAFARQETERARDHERRLRRLAAEGNKAWDRVEELVETGRSGSYDAAADLLTDLRELAERDGRTDEFDYRVSGLRERHGRRPAFLGRLATPGVTSRER